MIIEHRKILNLLNESNESKLVTRKQNIANNQSDASYDVGNEIIHNAEALKSNLCDYNHTYISVRVDITVTTSSTTQVSFKNCVPFTKCITKIDRKTIDDPEDLDLAMPMYNLIEYSSDYSKTTGSLLFYSKDEATHYNTDITKTNNFKSFKYKAKLLGKTVAQPAPNQANGILQKCNNC